MLFEKSFKWQIESNRVKKAFFFSQSEKRDDLTPSLPLFVFISSLRIPLSTLHDQPFIKKGSLEEMEGVNDNTGAFMHLNIETNK